MNEIRVVDGEVVRYAAEFPELDVRNIAFSWVQDVGTRLGKQIVQLMRSTTASAPIIGFGTKISDDEAERYLSELRDNLKAGKCRLMTIHTSNGDLIGVCTLRRNLNPNNAHITDLAKGMIDDRFRGRIVLPAAFYEIAEQCRKDGVELLTLDVRADTPAHQIWAHFGFEVYGTLDDYARVGGKRCAGHFMKQSVDALQARAYDMLRTRLAKDAATA